MAISDRINGWVEDRRKAWGDALGKFLLDRIAGGATKFTEDREPEIISFTRETLTKLRGTPGITPEMRNMIDKSLETGDIASVAAGWLMIILGAIPALMGLGAPLGRDWEYYQDRIIQSRRLDPMSVINAWRRDPETYAKYLDDLSAQGWSEDRIEALKFVTQYMPTPQDLVNWQAKEVFEPEMIAKYGLDDEFGGLDLTLFEKIGVTPEQALNYWRAHWEHASWNQVVEMVRRGQMTEPDVWDWFRLVEIPPFWRDKLIAISWEVPTRVDVRRFWDMRTIDEARLREIYTAQGYHGKDLEDYVLWTKIYVDFPDLMTRYKNGWLTLDDVRAELIKLGMSAERAEELIQTKVKAAASEKLAKDKDLTMSQIVKGVKKAVITRDEGALLLQDMGYDPYEAAFILAIEIPQDEVVTEVKIRELTKADILSGLKAAVITEDEALSRLIELRYLPDDAAFLLSIYKATISPPAEARQREASKADVVKAVKTGLITPEDGYLMLQDIGFTPEASAFILMVQAESSPFSPMSYNEFKDLTDKFHQVVKPGEATMPEEIKKAADEVVRVSGEVEALERSLAEEERLLVSEEILPAEATARKRKLQASLRKANAELARVKAEYERQVAEWKHGLP